MPSCILCDTHVPETVEHFSVWRVTGSGPRSIEGVMCLDPIECLGRAIERAASDAPVRTRHQQALRGIFGFGRPVTVRDATQFRSVNTRLDVALAKVSGLITGVTGVQTRLDAVGVGGGIGKVTQETANPTRLATS